MKTLEDVVAGLVEIVKDNPDQTNPGCVYTDEHGKHCLVGEWASRNGLPLPDVSTYMNGLSVRRTAENMEWDVSTNAVEALAKVQLLADTYYTWGEAVQELEIFLDTP